MKFVHIADMHFDSPFTTLGRIEGLSDLRRLEQRKIFKKIIEYIQENDIETLFIAGDLYENDYIRQSTIEYINNLFKTIPNTQVFIAPGNHDPYLINSYYMNYEWNSNVKIFTYNIEKYNYENICIYGYGFSSFYSEGINLKNIEIDKNKTNILVMHGDLDTSKNGNELYNPIATKDLEKFDYVALGHIHKPKYDNKIVYPGSTMAFGFDELGKHGFISGEIVNKKLRIEFVPIDKSEFKEIELDITKINSKEELIEKIQEIKTNKNDFYKIIITGKRNFEINILEINKLIQNDNILKIKDKTTLNYNLEKIKKENNMEGIFVNLILEKIKKTDDFNEKEKYFKALEIGLDSLKY